MRRWRASTHAKAHTTPNHLAGGVDGGGGSILNALILVNALQDEADAVVEVAAAVAEEEKPVVGPGADPMVKQQHQPQRPRAVATTLASSSIRSQRRDGVGRFHC
jgi:hypothetical protein